MIDTKTIRSNIKHGTTQYNEDDILALCDEIDRLRAGTPKPQKKTVRVKVAVAVNKAGYWRAVGCQTKEDILYANLRDYMHSEHRVYWLTADLPLPEETEIEAEVHTATTDENATSGGRG